ncbi:hypothetical protein H9633_10980 [Microbacterium sp. Re1]|uniref:Lipoprotein n=1 Tax=Microbacterium commune TaxID=2762219 RepID=A0ABR8W723_9MICO|nr:hypothetical protein [Microbacterium commune]MBD8012820.1 hypothetical protein [Microbacterium commune]
MRARLAAGLLMTAVLVSVVGCAPEPEIEVHVIDEGETAPPPERLGTVAQTMSDTCVTASAENPSEFESATLSTDGHRLIVTFKFERPFTLSAPEPYSISIGPKSRLIVEAGPVRAYVFLSADYEKQAISYVVRDDVIGGDIITNATLADDGDKLIMTVPLPADMSPYADGPVQWKVEAQGVDCPGDPDYDENWLWTDALMSME